jgi:peptide/nickel transport system substrate-binding protein
VIESIDAPDEKTVVFNLSRPTPSFLSIIANCWSLVLPKHILVAKGHMKEDLVGTGPFKFSKSTPGVSYELVKNTDYHVPDRPFMDSITAFVIPDSGTTWNYLQNGQLSLFYSIQGQDAGAFKTGGNVNVINAPSTSWIGTVFNTNVAPFDDTRVRKALSIGVDRKAALAVTYNGQGVFGGLTVPGKWALPESELAKIPGYGPNTDADIEGAKALLAEAGYPNGFDVDVLVRKNPLFEPVGVFVKDQWAKLGVNATLIVQENAAYAEARATGKFAVTASGGSYSLSDPDTVFGDEMLCGGSDDNLCPTELQELFAAQSAEMDEAERLAIANKLEVALLEKYGVHVMYWRDRFMGQSTRLKGFEVLHPNMDQNMRMEDVWLSA